MIDRNCKLITNYKTITNCFSRNLGGKTKKRRYFFWLAYSKPFFLMKLYTYVLTMRTWNICIYEFSSDARRTCDICLITLVAIYFLHRNHVGENTGAPIPPPPRLTPCMITLYDTDKPNQIYLYFVVLAYYARKGVSYRLFLYMIFLVIQDWFV